MKFLATFTEGSGLKQNRVRCFETGHKKSIVISAKKMKFTEKMLVLLACIKNTRTQV
jgi:hypothetical protein